jgi:hypothetical protein
MILHYREFGGKKEEFPKSSHKGTKGEEHKGRI